MEIDDLNLLIFHDCEKCDLQPEVFWSIELKPLDRQIVEEQIQFISFLLLVFLAHPYLMNTPS